MMVVMIRCSAKFATGWPFIGFKPYRGFDARPFSWRLRILIPINAGMMQMEIIDRKGKLVTLRGGRSVTEFINCSYLGLDLHPRVVDAYKSLGTLFGIELKTSNRWGGYRLLREKWQTHIDSTLLRPVPYRRVRLGDVPGDGCTNRSSGLGRFSLSD